MALFDPVEQRMCVRVVYDGAAGAGKTTNLRQLAALFAAQRTTEVTSPAELRGRTLYFDWMRIAAGVVCGFPLLCEVISVPGQVAFTERRRYLLASADVVVYVCDSLESAAERVREGLAVVDDVGKAAGRSPSIVLQANKQDQPNAFNGRGLLLAVGRRQLPVVEAIASDGIGVVDTFVSAVRTVAQGLQARMDGDGLRVPLRRAAGMNRVLARVAETPLDLASAAELLLEETSGELLFATRNTIVKKDGTPGALPVDPRASGAPKLAASTFAPLPDADVPTGFVWPAHTGRATLRALAREAAHLDGVRLEEGRAAITAESHVLSTTARDRFAEPEPARQALVRAARERTQLGGLLVSDTVLVVQRGKDGASWLWTIMPTTEPIAKWLALGDGVARLELLAAAVVHAVSVSRRHGLAFEPSLRAFGVQQGSVRYHGGLAPVPESEAGAATLLHCVTSELAALGHEAHLFANAVERELRKRERSVGPRGPEAA